MADRRTSFLAVVLLFAAVALMTVVLGAAPENHALKNPAPVGRVPDLFVTSAGSVPAIACSDSSSAEPAAKGGCKACPNKPYCGCTYNGAPRVSCEPCCYFSYEYGTICLD